MTGVAGAAWLLAIVAPVTGTWVFQVESSAGSLGGFGEGTFTAKKRS
jgi:hypothetical protein